MKSYVKIAVVSLTLALGGCGLTNPYEKWMDQGLPSPDRLLPSRLKATICNVGLWKTTIGGEDVYFDFGSDWSLESDSKALKLPTSEGFSVMSVSDDAIALTINGTHLKYYVDEADEVLLVNEFSETQIKATGKTTGKVYTLVPGSEAALKTIRDEKEPVLYTMRVCKALIASGYGSSIIRDEDQHFLARFALDFDNSEADFTIIDNGEAVHFSAGVSAVDDNNINFVDEVTIGGETITGFGVNEDDGVVLKGVSSIRATSAATGRNYFLSGDYETHVINFAHGDKGDCEQSIRAEIEPHDEWSDIEFNERDTRPVVFCPTYNDDGHYWYTFFDSFKNGNARVSSDFKDLIYMTKDGGYMDDPWVGFEKVFDEIWAQMPKILNFYYHEDGLIIVRDFDVDYSYMWFISPTTKYWVKAQRDLPDDDQ